MVYHKLVLIGALLFVCCKVQASGSIDEKLDYYETLETVNIDTIVKRSSRGSPRKHVRFSALGRNFSLSLSIAERLFTKDFRVGVVHPDGSETREFIDTDQFFYGTVEGEADSEVHAFLHDGEISATISLPGESYIIEPAWRHVDGIARASRTMMIYKGSDAKWPKEMEEAEKGGDGPAFCGASHIENTSPRFSSHDEDEHDVPHSRKKRELGNTVCRLIAVLDYKFYQNIAANSIYDAANYIVGIIQKVNLIYKSTSFSVGTGYGVELAYLRIHDGPTPVSNGATHYNMLKSWTNSYELLQEFSRGGWNDYCLAHLFTHQSFSNNVLGLAYIASKVVGNPGGICSPNYNTGLTTTKYTSGGTVLAKQSQLVTAHEIGHNWGSEHDPTSGDCAPGSILGDGKYLMYPYAVTGEDPNNDIFSSCSRNYINQVLNNKAATCFSVDSSGDICGNGKIDSGEDCDGGTLGKYDLDPCCTSSCRFKNSAQCSPMNHHCCTEQCTIAAAGVQCSADLQETCIGKGVCTGSSSICPVGANKPPGTPCLDGGQCDGNGKCQAFCEARGLQSCVCENVADSCKRCCKDTTLATPTCTAPNATSFHQDGRPCAVGYCSRGTCIKTDPSYISRFFDLIDQIDFDFIAEAFKTNMVAFIQVFSLLIWVPVSCFCWWRDKKSQKWFRNEEKIERRNNRNLLVDQDGRPVVRPTKPRPDNKYLMMEPRSLAKRPYSSRAPSSRGGGEKSGRSEKKKNRVKPNRRRGEENSINMSRDIDGDSVA